jgi:hypothetical protein
MARSLVLQQIPSLFEFQWLDYVPIGYVVYVMTLGIVSHSPLGSSVLEQIQFPCHSSFLVPYSLQASSWSYLRIIHHDSISYKTVYRITTWPKRFGAFVATKRKKKYCRVITRVNFRQKHNVSKTTSLSLFPRNDMIWTIINWSI